MAGNGKQGCCKALQIIMNILIFLVGAAFLTLAIIGLANVNVFGNSTSDTAVVFQEIIKAFPKNAFIGVLVAAIFNIVMSILGISMTCNCCSEKCEKCGDCCENFLCCLYMICLIVVLLLTLAMAIFFTIVIVNPAVIGLSQDDFSKCPDGGLSPSPWAIPNANAISSYKWSATGKTQCPIDFGIWSLITTAFAAGSNSQGAQGWNAMQNVLGCCGYYCGSSNTGPLKCNPSVNGSPTVQSQYQWQANAQICAVAEYDSCRTKIPAQIASAGTAILAVSWVMVFLLIVCIPMAICINKANKTKNTYKPDM